jgi:pimeloyl-ACP methyl ester carboxylesterase
MAADEALYRIDGVELCAQTFGRRDDPAVLLIMGAMASMVWWPAELCERLAARGRFVVRYDQRDTGRSETHPLGPPAYSVDDLAADAIGLLDALGIRQATLAGMSLGGFIAQLVALRAPERVRALALIASEPLGPGEPGLPGIDPAVLAYHAGAAGLDWSDRAAVIDYMVGGWRLLAGSARPFDEALIRGLAGEEVRRARDPRAAANHAMLAGGEAWFGRLAEIRQPAVVIHGSDDNVLPYGNALALARDIRGARLVTLQGAGHELHPLDWDTIVDEVVAVGERQA